ncbi:efflux RND transporter periplasmic adaptor subunit [Taibaiella chishuiensis]|uniref:HlyD family secretion protein n=1 Tax=Taibaiella chishuiensis TaxID=1434707 RepID=A0A2P8CZM9_9BACT|nr:HlyD family efflux transporter periplasmic adaptor subunit [Taibaiella chishuiensis]PSK90425.1 HlyD family secretion protein [Taibaiella chishuiensis]
MYIKTFFLSIAAGCVCLVACNNNSAEPAAAAEPVQTPVTVSGILHEPMSDYLELNATSVFLLKHVVKANTNGYLSSVHITAGQAIGKGMLLFSIKTKEAMSLGNSLAGLDSSFHFSGVNSIRAGAQGFITQLDHQQGDYVQDGEPLATISDNSSFVFLMSMPYELRPFVPVGKKVVLTLPDSTQLDGTVTAAMPQVDSFSQSQNMVIRVNAPRPIPENLIAKVRILKSEKASVIAVPKAAVLTDEAQEQFWIMKMAGNNLAVKVPVKKGMEDKGNIEILDPKLEDADRVLVSGNYGLEDSARVKIIKSVP